MVTSRRDSNLTIRSHNAFKLTQYLCELADASQHGAEVRSVLAFGLAEWRINTSLYQTSLGETEVYAFVTVSTAFVQTS